MRDLLMLLFTKERLWVIHSCGSLQKREWERMLFKKRAMWVMLSWFKQIACKKWVICKKIVFFIGFWHFPPLFMNVFRCSSLIRSFVISDLSNLLLSLFTKVCPWAIRSGCSCQKRGRAIYRKVENCQKQMKKKLLGG